MRKKVSVYNLEKIPQTHNLKKDWCNGVCGNSLSEYA